MDKLELKKEKTRLFFVDDSNLGGMKREIGKELDMIELFKLLAQKGDRIFFYYRPIEITQSENQEEPFLRYLDFLQNRLWRALAREGISLVVFPATRSDEDAMIITDIAISVYKREWLGLKDDVVEIVLISGDGGFAKILELAKEEEKKILVIAGRESCSKRLTEIAYEVLYIQDLVEEYPELILEHERVL